MKDQKSTMSPLVLGALLTVYFVWGSTYLGIKYVNQTMPALLSAGIRFLAAGSILFAWKYLERKPLPTLKQARNSAVTGILLFLLGNGAVVVALKRMDSGIAALLIALTPLIMVFLEMKFGKSAKPGLLTFAGMFLGLVGLAIIINPFTGGVEGVHWIDVLTILFAITFWAIGSIFIRNAEAPESMGVSASIQMLAGGVSMIIASGLLGEFSQVNVEAFSQESIIAFFYLIFFGSILAFSAYNYLLKTTAPALTSTYAYVNPVIAMILGAVIGGEIVSSASILAATVIIIGVCMITIDTNRRKRK